MIDERDSSSVREAVSNADSTITSLISYTELRSALARIRRDGLVPQTGYRSVLNHLENMWLNYHVVEVSQSIVFEAGELAESHSLSGADAIQLASALATLKDLEVKSVFATWDRRLWKAARREGLNLIPEAAP